MKTLWAKLLGMHRWPRFRKRSKTCLDQVTRFRSTGLWQGVASVAERIQIWFSRSSEPSRIRSTDPNQQLLLEKDYTIFSIGYWLSRVCFVEQQVNLILFNNLSAQLFSTPFSKAGKLVRLWDTWKGDGHLNSPVNWTPWGRIVQLDTGHEVDDRVARYFDYCL